MQITVKNYRGIESAELTVAPIALAVGNNGAGKSSIAQAVASVLTGTATPPGMLKKDAGQLLRDGQSRGYCSVDDAKINWPGGSGNTGLISATPVAAGTLSPLDMKPAEAAAYLSGLLNAEPTIDDLKAALANMPENLIASVWSEIVGSGWDAANKRAKEAGTRIKGQWEQITGEQYGSKKALEWLPACFADGVPPVEDLQEKVTEWKNKVDSAIANAAVSADRIAELQRVVDAGNEAEQRLPTLQQNVDDFAKQLADANAVYESIPEPISQEVTVACPCCSAALVVVSRTVLQAATGKVDEDENQRRSDARAQQAALIRDIADKKRAAESELFNAQQLINAGTNAANTLSTLSTEGATEADIEHAREMLTSVEYQQMMLNSLDESKKKVTQLEQNQVIVSALSADGLRQSVLVRVLDNVNSELLTMSQKSGWGAVSITPEMQIQYSGRDYRLLSASEQFRCRVTLQLYISERDGSGAVVIDAADILDRGGRNGLFKLLKGWPIPVLVCMTMNAKEDAPDLKKIGMGRTYWIENSTAVEI